ncbi:MAG: sulfite exporter TauE/SafE family protein [Phycisphaeraceae bacterium]|nr:MAG: sulfite exporter TauE/SafE family protein [Phycisphaeraceae bacterium]
MTTAWLGAAAVGLTLGLLGSGGAILTVPILVYLVGHGEKSAIAESLAIVASIAAVGALRAAAQGRVDVRNAALLAFPGVVGTIVGVTLSRFIPGAVQLALLAVLMLAASAMMLKGQHRSTVSAPAQHAAPPTSVGPVSHWSSRPWGVAAQGVGLGMVTGLVGVGGGFLIVPVLVLIRRLPMPTAVGTSLAVIAFNSAFGFLKHLTPTMAPATTGEAVAIDWGVVGTFSVVGIAGSLAGGAIAGRIHQHILKRAFAVFLILMAGYILVRQAPIVLQAPTAAAPQAGRNLP